MAHTSIVAGGAILVMSALFLVVMVVACALAIDLGQQAKDKRDDHKVADLVSLDAVRAHLDTAGLARQKWPEELRAIEEFPRTPSGKVQKFALRDRLRREADGPA